MLFPSGWVKRQTVARSRYAKEGELFVKFARRGIYDGPHDFPDDPVIYYWPGMMTMICEYMRRDRTGLPSPEKIQYDAVKGVPEDQDLCCDARTREFLRALLEGREHLAERLEAPVLCINFLEMPADVDHHVIHRALGMSWFRMEVVVERILEGKEEELGRLEFRVEGLDRIDDVISPYVLVKYMWQGKLPYGVYFQWVPAAEMDEGYPTRSRFYHRVRKGYNWVTNETMWELGMFEGAGNRWDFEKGTFVLTLDFTGFVNGLRRRVLYDHTLSMFRNPRPRWWFVDEGVLGREALNSALNLYDVIPHRRIT